MAPQIEDPLVQQFWGKSTMPLNQSGVVGEHRFYGGAQDGKEISTAHLFQKEVSFDTIRTQKKGKVFSLVNGKLKEASHKAHAPNEGLIQPKPIEPAPKDETEDWINSQPVIEEAEAWLEEEVEPEDDTLPPAVEDTDPNSLDILAQETFAESVGYVAEEEPRPCAPVVEDEPPQLAPSPQRLPSQVRKPKTPKGPSLAQLAALDEAWKRWESAVLGDLPLDVEDRLLLIRENSVLKNYRLLVQFEASLRDVSIPELPSLANLPRRLSLKDHARRRGAGGQLGQGSAGSTAAQKTSSSSRDRLQKIMNRGKKARKT